MESCKSNNHEKIKNKLINSPEFSEKVKEASNIFSLLGDESRMRILLALCEGELCVYHICEITGGKQSATSQHLRKLKDNNIVKSRKEANQVLYSLADEHIKEIIEICMIHLECDYKSDF